MSKPLSKAKFLTKTSRPALAKAVIAQLGTDWQSELQNVASHGGNIGVGNFIYNSELEDFFWKHQTHIRSSLKDDADNFGNDSAIALVKTFKNVKDGDATEDEIGEALYGTKKQVGKDNSVPQYLATYALEVVAFDFESFRENDGQ